MRVRALVAGAAVALLVGTAAAVLVLGDGDDEAPTPEPVAAPAPVENTVPVVDLPDEGYGWIVVRVGKEATVHDSPGGKVIKKVGRQTEWGSPSVFSVIRRDGRWAGVPTPWLPNGKLGWIELDGRRLRGGSLDESIVVDLSDRRGELRRGKRVLRSFAITVGMPGAETPTGRFAVTDSFRGDLNPAYGCCALALTARQPHLPSGWLGGNRIAIHATSGPLGVAASHGCIRASNEDANALINRVPLATPVFIRQ
jgi:hypothetical protein